MARKVLAAQGDIGAIETVSQNAFSRVKIRSGTRFHTPVKMRSGTHFHGPHFFGLVYTYVIATTWFHVVSEGKKR